MSLLPTNTTERYYLIARVLQSLDHNMSKTADTLGVSFNTVKNVSKWIEDGMPHKKQPGRPKILNESMKYYICINTMYNPEISCEQLAQNISQIYKVDVSDSTVRNCRHKYAFKYGPRVRSLFLSPKNIADRLIFSNWFITHRFNHRKLIFSDESWFELGTLNHYVWRIMGKRVEKAHPKTIPELIQILNDVWYNQITFHTINLLIDSFITRLNKCIQNNGGQVRF